MSDRALAELPSHIGPLHSYIDRTLQLQAEMEEKLKLMSPEQVRQEWLTPAARAAEPVTLFVKPISATCGTSRFSPPMRLIQITMDNPVPLAPC